MVFKKPGNSRDDKSKKPSNRFSKSGDRPDRNSSSVDKSSASRPKKFSNDTGKPERKYSAEGSNDRKFSARGSGDKPAYGDRPKRSFGDKPAGDRKFGNKPGFGERSGDRDFDKKPSFRGDKSGESKSGDRRPAGNGGFRKRNEGDEKPYRKREDRGEGKPFRERSGDSEQPNRVMRGRKNAPEKKDDGLIRLNRYISNAGICSRRKADELIAAGVVSVNGEVISELGHKIDPVKDVIRYNGETLKREKMVYVLLNKPKDYITTTDDPQERRTVMHLVEKASRERIYPVGRLDRNTTGLLLMTNDGDLADKLSHPRNNVVKIYQVELSKSLTQGDLNKISFGLELEDGFIKPDMVTYVQGGTKKEIGIQIHSGKNRIVRRIFEHLGYEVVKLDRAVYANLTKKDLPRGRWRYLDEKEVIQLKHLIQ